GGNKEDVLRYGIDGMSGLLVGEAYQFLSRCRVDNLPSQKHIAKEVIHVNQGSFGKYLLGSPSGTEDWTKHARKILRYLLQGNTPTEERERKELVALIDDYFFREFNPAEKTDPAFFQPSRQRFREP